MAYKLPIILTPQPEGGFTVTSPLLPELLTEGDDFQEVMTNLPDAIRAVIEIYEEDGLPIPANIIQDSHNNPIWFDYLLAG